MEIKKEKFCYYPFTQMLFQPTGHVTPCCWNQKLVVGDNRQTPIMEIWNGPQMQELRKEFLSGNPVSCRDQMKYIRCHIHSQRAGIATSDPRAEMLHGPRRIDVRLNGKCNLKCVMCDVWKQPNGIFDATDFWSTGQNEIFPYLKEIDVLGGEPFVQKDTFRLIKEIGKVNPKCSWAFVTNGNYQFWGAIEEHLDQIPLRWIQVSLDAGSEDTYKKIRKDGSFKKATATLLALKQYQETRQHLQVPFHLTASFCLQAGNWQDANAFLDLCKEAGVKPVFQFLFDPSDLSLLALPKKVQEAILRYLKSLKCEPDILRDAVDPLEDGLKKATELTY